MTNKEMLKNAQKLVSKKTTKAKAPKKNNDKKVNLLVVNIRVKKPNVSVKRISETHELKLNGYTIYAVVKENTVELQTYASNEEFIFDTKRNNATKERWQAIGQLIIEASKLI